MTEQEYVSMLQNNTAAANAFNASQSQKQMDFQVAQNAKAMEFNSRQAELNRNWQEMMSNTAHQREVKDLIAAGLNPVLSALGGSGASVGAGSAASVAGTQGSKSEADTSLNTGIAGLLSAMISGQTQRDVANINAAASMRNAELSADATKYAANTNYAGLMQQLEHMEQYPTTLFGTLSSLFQGFFKPEGESLIAGLPGLLSDFNSVKDIMFPGIFGEHNASAKLIDLKNTIKEKINEGLSKIKTFNNSTNMRNISTGSPAKDAFRLLNNLYKK